MYNRTKENVGTGLGKWILHKVSLIASGTAINGNTKKTIGLYCT